MKKDSEIQISQSLNIGAAFFGKLNTGKGQANDKDPAIKESKKCHRAQLLWTLKVASSHFSLRSYLGLNELFQSMFTYGEIVKSFQLSKTKCSYIVNFRLAPYFKDLLLKEIKASDSFRILFCESMNKVMQEEQMDVQIRYWNETAKLVDTRHPNVKYVFNCLITSLKDLPSERLLQLSMDSSNTNWSVLTMLHNDRCEKDYPRIIDIDSCSLHVLHGVFKSGVEARDWFLNKILKAMWKIFHGSPARRDTSITICEVDEFPPRY